MTLSFSVVVTVRNEERNLPPLLDSLVTQEAPIEVHIVDSDSEDRTIEIARRYDDEFEFVHTHLHGGTRAAGRNFGIARSDSPFVSFIDGDCIASPFWIHGLRRAAERSDVLAGKTVQIGYRPFEDLERVELIYGGYDITYPSCNLAYRRELLDQVRGFDEWFMTAEDVDLNLRAVEAGATITYVPEAIVYHRTRGSYFDFLKQAFWNGSGRKQLTLKHGRLWSSYRPRELLRRQASPLSALRLASASLGYIGYKVFGAPRPGERS